MGEREPAALYFMKFTLQTSELKKGQIGFRRQKRLEAHAGPLGDRHQTGTKIRLALEMAGIEFIDKNCGGSLRERPKR